MWGEGWLGTERLQSTKPFLLLKIFLASLIVLVAEELSPALWEDLPSDVTLRQHFSSKLPLFVSWKSDKEEQAGRGSRALTLLSGTRVLTGRTPVL